jgi:hypothetical protein
VSIASSEATCPLLQLKLLQEQVEDDEKDEEEERK